jgi:hypothetical protein
VRKIYIFAVALMITACASGPTPDEQRNREDGYRYTANADADPVLTCKRAMALRPITTRGDAGVGGWMMMMNAQRAAMALCETDPQAHLKPLPWEGEQASAQRQPQPVVCFAQPGGVVVCP